jgi:hypothetical protein
LPKKEKKPIGLFVDQLIQRFGKEKFMSFFTIQTYEHAKLIFGDEIDVLIEELEDAVQASGDR